MGLADLLYSSRSCGLKYILIEFATPFDGVVDFWSSGFGFEIGPFELTALPKSETVDVILMASRSSSVVILFIAFADKPELGVMRCAASSNMFAIGQFEL